MFSLREIYSYFTVNILFWFLCLLNILKVKNVSVHTNRSSPLPYKTLLLKCLISSPAFNQCDFVTSHYVTVSIICIIYA